MNTIIKTFVLITVIAAIAGCDANMGMDSIYQQVANDSVNQFNLTVKGGDSMEICTYAGMVVAAYTQAQDEQNYLTWKVEEKRLCQEAEDEFMLQYN